ncbi:hypothetical protein F0562_018808 [Nyssa sinensis]|uniref:DUF506 domain-containing protein n=1 Tax=Nyssa sinensis TaxID=561372 RepID=A0A5J4ZE50_9ASTE|nr:hypothetical protein F0562_018808 [Nyssa sinensis]
MAKIPVRFKRVAAVFDEVARARLCESSGSEHSPENSMNLSHLVKSFMERENREDGDIDEVNQEEELNQSESESFGSYSEMKDMLRSSFGCSDDHDVKRNVHSETKQACRLIGNSSSPGFKRRLMTRLRERGFDAGLCKSTWEKTGRLSPGQYEYIDVNVAGNRYIIEVSLAGEFEIARPMDRYTSLLEEFPAIFVGKVDELKQVVRLMCNAIKQSMKSMDMPVPPWRRHRYMQAKWFGSYKRTTNENPVRKAQPADSDEDSARKRSVGFAPLPAVSYFCREDYASKIGSKVGLLAAVLNDTCMLL